MPGNLARYLMVGGVSYLIEMAALYTFKNGLRYSALVAVAISFWVGLITAFILQKVVAFKNYDRSVKTLSRQIIVYGLLVAWNYVFTLIAVKLFSKDVSVFIIRTIIIILTTSWNFIIYRILFKIREESVENHGFKKSS